MALDQEEVHGAVEEPDECLLFAQIQHNTELLKQAKACKEWDVKAVEDRSSQCNQRLADFKIQRQRCIHHTVPLHLRCTGHAIKRCTLEHDKGAVHLCDAIVLALRALLMGIKGIENFMTPGMPN